VEGDLSVGGGEPESGAVLKDSKIVTGFGEVTGAKEKSKISTGFGEMTGAGEKFLISSPKNWQPEERWQKKHRRE